MDRLTEKSGFVNGIVCQERGVELYWRLKSYEDTGLTPEEINDLKWLQAISGVDIPHALDLLQLEKSGRIQILYPPEGSHCGTCAHFRRIPCTKRGQCATQKQRCKDEPRMVHQSTRACRGYLNVMAD